MAITRVLIVDDEPDILEIFGIELRNRGYQVQVARDGEEALKLAAGFKPHVVISDISMPNVDGVDFISRLKSSEQFRDIPFIVISGRGDDQNKLEMEKLGADGYMDKPINFNHLSAKIQNILKKRENHGPISKPLFSGRLSEMSVLEVTQLLHQARKSGLLKVEGMKGEFGEVAFNDGTITYAVYGEYFGKVAFHHVIRIVQGEFSLVDGENPQLYNIWDSTTKLIMESAAQLDQFDIEDINKQLFMPVGSRFWMHCKKILIDIESSFDSLKHIVIFETSGRILATLKNNLNNAQEISALFLNLNRMTPSSGSRGIHEITLLKTNKFYYVFILLKDTFILAMAFTSDAQIGVVISKIKKKIPEISDLLNY